MARQKKKKKKVKKAAKRAATKKTMRKTASRKKAAPRRRASGKAELTSPVAFEPAGLKARSGGQSGDLQGLSDRRRADSESVDELLEEGNAFEAEAIKGVEDADDADADDEEVHTHEISEDDVPEEYDDEDQQT